MAILEPALSETVVLTCMVIFSEAIEEAVKQGVPPEAARAFILGHMNVNVGILFKYIDAELSDGAKLAVSRAKTRIFQPDWKSVFEPEKVMANPKRWVRPARGTCQRSGPDQIVQSCADPNGGFSH